MGLVCFDKGWCKGGAGRGKSAGNRGIVEGPSTCRMTLDSYGRTSLLIHLVDALEFVVRRCFFFTFRLVLDRRDGEAIQVVGLVVVGNQLW